MPGPHAHKLGKLDPVRPAGLATLAAYAKKPIPAPPHVVASPKKSNWGMYLNDVYGDCVIAGGAHDEAAWNLLTGRKDALPTDATVKRVYLGLSPNDEGLVIADTLTHWHHNGLFSATDKIQGFAPIELGDQTGLRRAVAFLGIAKLGIQLPDSAEQQFASGRPWSIVHGAHILGGHDVEITGYDDRYAELLTWGELVQVEWAFLAKYTDEAWAIVPRQFVEAKHGTPIDVADHYDLAALEAALPQAA